MLVLSRRPNEEIVFPNIGIRIRLLGFKRNVARIGVDAPPDMSVLRGELVSDVPPAVAAQASRDDLHHLRNQLNKVSLGLHHYRQQSEAGLAAEANRTLDQVLSVLEALDRVWPSLKANRPKPEPTTHRNRLRALLVEDDANERELLAGILGMHGCHCEQASDGQDAIDYLSSHELPDLVLLDMGLPRVSGPQTLGRIRQEARWNRLKVFAVSGADPSELGIPVGTGGVDAWFTKPLNPRRLCDAINQRAS